MATQDINANIHIKDESGNINNIYPATKIENVEGLQSALNAKANSSDVTSGLAGKVDKETGKGLSTNDYTTTEKNKLTQLKFIVTPQMFGAKGDGSTDDTQAIQDAINSLDYGGVITFPSGIYIISDTINLPDINKVSLKMENAIIKQSVALSPMIKVASGNSGDNYPQRIYGIGTIDMDGLGGVGIQVTNNGGYASINDIQVRNCSDGVGIMLGDTLEGTAVSLQAELNNVKIYGNDSKLNGTGLYVNAYDCVFNNLYIYLCKIGCQTYHGGHNFSFVHIWTHSYETWTEASFVETIGFKLRGTSFFNTLYLDSVYTGIQTNGYDQLINNCYYTSDIRDTAISNVVGRVVERNNTEKVIINNGLFYNPHVHKMQVFYINNNESVASVTVGRMCKCDHVVQDYNKWIPFDEANNITVNNLRANPVRRSAVEQSKAYKIGYIKLTGAENMKMRVGVKGAFCGDINCRVVPDHLDTYNTTYKAVYVPSSYNVHIYYGTMVTFQGINYLPIYMGFSEVVTVLPYVECDNIEDSGFYPCYAESFSDLEKVTDTTSLTEFIEAAS